jgi:hypothetical protein
MTKLAKGTLIWISKHEARCEPCSTWWEWNGCCAFRRIARTDTYDKTRDPIRVSDLEHALSLRQTFSAEDPNSWFGRRYNEDWLCMAEQLIAEGSIG